MSSRFNLETRFEELAAQMRERDFTPVANALRARTESILRRWRAQSIKAMPTLDRVTIGEFEDSMAAILNAVAAAMETDDPQQLRELIEQAPFHGTDRYLQNFPLDVLLAEGSILRGAIIIELREHTGQMLAEDEAAALHELVDLTFDHGILAFIHRRSEQREQEMQQQMFAVHRLADLGTLVAGVAHDATNLLLPLRLTVQRLKDRCDGDAAELVKKVEEILEHFQNTIINLRWLTVDPSRKPREIPPLNLRSFAHNYHYFQRTLLPSEITFVVDVPEDMPAVRITQAALSQALFNLVRNSREAMLYSRQDRGRIVLRGEKTEQGKCRIIVEDDGPGMTPEVRERCLEPFFTTHPQAESMGLGLTLVHALVSDVGGTIEVHSPPPGKPNAAGGTAVVLQLEFASASAAR